MPEIPSGETARIDALNRYGILDTAPEPKFDRITKLVSDICEAPIALISLIDNDRQWFKSRVGLDATETPRDIAFCAHAILQDGLFIVPDATTDERFHDNPLVLGDPGIRTYMGAPLVTGDGFRIGTLCVLYSQITTIPETRKEQISSLAEIVVDELELRVALRDVEVASSAAEESEARFHDIAQAAGEWIWETDEHHRFTYISDCSAELGLSPFHLIGRTRWDVPGIDIDPDQLDAHIEVLKKRQPFRLFGFNFIGRKGGRHYRQISGNPVFHRDGSFKGYRGTTTDITAQVETFEELKAAKFSAEQANNMKSEFLAKMSHELRTPLNAIVGFSELMLRAAPDAFSKPVYLDYTRDIKQSGEDILNIVDDILDLSKLEAGRPDLNESPVDIHALIQGVVNRSSLEVGAANLTVAMLFEDDMPLLLADELKLKQILINLLSNAIKFTLAHGMITVSADFSAEAGHIIKVSDTGIGIASEDFDKILAPFRQADCGPSRKFYGTGLGLPLAASFAEMHGGRLKILSETDVGTTVEVRFPPERIVQKENRGVNAALTLDQAMQQITSDEYARSCLITDPKLPDNPIVYVTPEFEKQTGYSKSEAIGRNCRFLQGPMSDPKTMATIREAIENNAPVIAVIVNYRKDGSPFRNHLSIRPMLDSNGEIASFVAVQSITDMDGADIRHENP